MNDEQERDQDRPNPPEEAIRARAYERFMAHGEHGRDLEDWLAAEQELREHPITTASQEAELRGMEAEAAEEKRQAESTGN